MILSGQVLRIAMGPSSVPWKQDVLSNVSMPGQGKFDFATAVGQRERLLSDCLLIIIILCINAFIRVK